MKGTMDYKLLQYKKDLIDICSEESNEDSDQCPEEIMDNGQCPQKLLDTDQCQTEREQKEIIRSSMHWDEFFGNSILHIYIGFS